MSKDFFLSFFKEEGRYIHTEVCDFGPFSVSVGSEKRKAVLVVVVSFCCISFFECESTEH